MKRAETILLIASLGVCAAGAAAAKWEVAKVRAVAGAWRRLDRRRPDESQTKPVVAWPPQGTTTVSGATILSGAGAATASSLTLYRISTIGVATAALHGPRPCEPNCKNIWPWDLQPGQNVSESTIYPSAREPLRDPAETFDEAIRTDAPFRKILKVRGSEETVDIDIWGGTPIQQDVAWAFIAGRCTYSTREGVLVSVRSPSEYDCQLMLATLANVEVSRVVAGSWQHIHARRMVIVIKDRFSGDASVEWSFARAGGGIVSLAETWKLTPSMDLFMAFAEGRQISR